jgi:hypothetical protein
MIYIKGAEVHAITGFRGIIGLFGEPKGSGFFSLNVL